MATLSLLRPDSAEWPEPLTRVHSPPKELHTLGDPSVLARPGVAIVGTRHPTPYGEHVARELATALAQAGACIVSGMAIGIDAAAHRAALDAGGTTAAVLGAGIDQIYPSSNRKLYHRIAEAGVVVSEFEPGRQSFEGCFPRRNRIIAALSRLTIVVEAGSRSGALITASYALSFARDVAAVPGRIDAESSTGANRLLRDGAHVITCVDDALALAKFTTRIDTTATARDSAQPSLAIGSDEAEVWQLLATGGVSTDDLVHRTAWPVARCLVAVTNLELQGLVACTPSGAVHRR